MTRDDLIDALRDIRRELTRVTDALHEHHRAALIDLRDDLGDVMPDAAALLERLSAALDAVPDPDDEYDPEAASLLARSLDPADVQRDRRARLLAGMPTECRAIVEAIKGSRS